MKNLFKTSFILLALMGVLFTSCKKDYEVPPIPVLPVGELYSISRATSTRPSSFRTVNRAKPSSC